MIRSSESPVGNRLSRSEAEHVVSAGESAEGEDVGADGMTFLRSGGVPAGR